MKSRIFATVTACSRRSLSTTSSPGAMLLAIGIREDKTILHDRTGLAAPYVGIQVPEGGIADPHVPLVGVVKTEQEFHDRRLPAPAGPYDGGHPVMGYRQVDILQHVIPVRPVIAEAEIFQP